jgi:hypothetical protein
MSPVASFLLGVALTLAASSLVVLYLRSHLKGILIDLCGTGERAGFWMAFTNVALVLVPVIFALHARPENASTAAAIFAVSAQLEWALIGLVAAVLVMGVVLHQFIARQPQAVAAAPAKPAD